MPGLLERSAQFCGCGGGYGVSDGIWSKHRGDITAAQLQKFWNALPYHARRELLKIDKQKLFEQARKNLYCSRCNGLLLEGFSQIIMYGKSLQLEDADTFAPPSCSTSNSEVSANQAMRRTFSGHGDWRLQKRRREENSE